MAETGKKAKAPAKPRAASAAKSTTPKPTAGTKSSRGSAQTTATAEKISAYRPTHHEIAALAERYWAERGHTDGQAEQDWLRAEQELMKVAS